MWRKAACPNTTATLPRFSFTNRRHASFRAPHPTALPPQPTALLKHFPGTNNTQKSRNAPCRRQWVAGEMRRGGGWGWRNGGDGRGSEELDSAGTQPGVSSRCPGDNFNNSRGAACPSAATAGPAAGMPASPAQAGAAAGRAGPRHMPGGPPASSLETSSARCPATGG